MNIVGEIYRN